MAGGCNLTINQITYREEGSSQTGGVKLSNAAGVKVLSQLSGSPGLKNGRRHLKEPGFEGQQGWTAGIPLRVHGRSLYAHTEGPS